MHCYKIHILGEFLDCGFGLVWLTIELTKPSLMENLKLASTLFEEFDKNQCWKIHVCYVSRDNEPFECFKDMV